MGTLISIVITALFWGIILTKKFPVGRLYKKMRGIRKSTFVKPFDCLPCMTFWLSIVACTAFHLLGWNANTQTYLISIMASFLAAYLIDKEQ